MYNFYTTNKEYTLTPCKQLRLKKQIKAAAGSFYRMNVQSATCYAFSYDTIGQKYLDGTTCKKIDFSGGFDWYERLVDTTTTHIYQYDNGQFYKVELI